jgi:hypothetical protein
MLHTLFGTFRWLWVLLLVLGLAGTYFFWEERERVTRVDREGLETVAQLIQIRQQTSGQNKSPSYWADIRWRDQTGAVRLGERIPVSGTFVRRVSKDGRLVQAQTRIKYLPSHAEVRPLLLEDGARNNAGAPFMLWFSLGLAGLSAAMWVHGLSFERRAGRKTASTAV